MSKSRRTLQVTPSALTEAERRMAHVQALADTRIEGQILLLTCHEERVGFNARCSGRDQLDRRETCSLRIKG